MTPVYALTNRPCSVLIYPDRIVVAGEFYYLNDMDFYRGKAEGDAALLKDYLGMGILAKRSWRKTLLFVISSSVLFAFKAAMEKLSELMDKANEYLKWIGESVSMPEWADILLNTGIVLCLLFAILLFFSKKKVVEISFTTKRLCVLKKHVSDQEFFEMNRIISELKAQL